MNSRFLINSQLLSINLISKVRSMICLQRSYVKQGVIRVRRKPNKSLIKQSYRVSKVHFPVLLLCCHKCHSCPSCRWWCRRCQCKCQLLHLISIKIPWKQWEIAWLISIKWCLIKSKCKAHWWIQSRSSWSNHRISSNMRKKRHKRSPKICQLHNV